MILAHIVLHVALLHGVIHATPFAGPGGCTPTFGNGANACLITATSPCPPSRGEACNTWPEEHRYWIYLISTYLNSVRMPNVSFEWYTELQEWSWVLVIAGAYFLGTIFTYRNHNKRGAATDPRGPAIQDLYPVESYNGYVTERNGGVDNFNWAVIIVVTLYTGLVIVSNIVNAQIY